MMPEIAMNVLDIAQNSVRAEATLIQLTVDVNQATDMLTIIIEDDGCGMTPEQVEHVVDPFFTTRTTRNVGLGVPFWKLAAISAGGTFDIQSEVGKGTVVTTTFQLSNIDRMPLGDINGTVHTLITFNTHIDFLYTYRFNEKSFTLDTREFKEVLDGVPLDEPEVSSYIRAFLDENKFETDGGMTV